MRRTYLAVSRFLVVLLLLVGTAPSWAAPTKADDDAAVNAEMDKIVASDIAEANYGAARRRLQGLVERCKKRANVCTNKTLVNVTVMLGVTGAQSGQREAALQNFASVFDLDPNAQLPTNADATDATKRLFAEARADYEARHPRADDPYKVTWKKKEAAGLFIQGFGAQRSKDWPLCIEKIKAALDIEDNNGARMHLAECLDGAGRLIESAREVSTALERGRRDHDDTVVAAAATLGGSLVKRFGRVKFEVPANFTDLKVYFDDRLVPKERLVNPVVVDPGTHRMKAEGTVGGNLVIDAQEITVPDGQTVNVKVSPKPRAVTTGQYECILNAKSEAELAICFEKKKTSPIIRASADISGYADTQRVNVVTPGIRASIEAPTGEWHAGGAYLLDVVSAASADVVSMASGRFHDTRHAGSIGGGYRFSPVTLNAAANLSVESDYVSRGVDGTVGIDLFDKQFTPELGYGIGYDTIGRRGTPYDVFSNNLTTHSIHGSGTIILSPKTLIVVGLSIQLERGDQSKPYRYIPMFSPGSDVPNHASVKYVNATRLPERPLEQLPLERDRFALAGRFITRLRQNATLRIEQRLYRDSWGIVGTTTDARYLVDVGPRLLVWTALRLHLQSEASFFERAYFASGTANGTVQVPIVRTTDRELGGLLSPSPGVGTRLALTNPSSEIQMGLTLQATLMLSKYFDSLYTGARTAIYGTTGFDFEFK